MNVVPRSTKNTGVAWVRALLGFIMWSCLLCGVVEEEEANDRNRSKTRIKRMPLNFCLTLGVARSLSNNSSKGEEWKYSYSLSATETANKHRHFMAT